MFTLNPYWIVASSLAVWFLFVHSPPILLQPRTLERPLFVVHLVGAYLVYIACILNTGRKPWSSLTSHVLIGQIGMIAGVIGFVGGLLYVILHFHEIDIGFSIPITIGGLLQMNLQYQGYKAIQKYRQVKVQLITATKEDALVLQEQRNDYLRTHISCMIALFCMGCGVPAAMRLTHRLGFPSKMAAWAALGLLSIFKKGYQTD